MVFGIDGLGVNRGFTYFNVKQSLNSKLFKNEE